MTSEEEGPTTPARVSILARIVPALSYALPALGAAITALLLLKVLNGMRQAESTGVAAVAAGISEANLAILVTLYLAIFAGIGGVVIGLVRMFTTVVTATPSAWYFLFIGTLGLLPMFALWRAQSMMLDALFSRSVGMAEVAGQITLFSIVAIILGVVSILVVLASSFLPLPAILRAKRKWAPFIILLIMETAIIGMTLLYQLRTAWLYAEYQRY